jgi:hypothetical protein
LRSMMGRMKMADLIIYPFKYDGKYYEVLVEEGPYLPFDLPNEVGPNGKVVLGYPGGNWVSDNPRPIDPKLLLNSHFLYTMLTALGWHHDPEIEPRGWVDRW